MAGVRTASIEVVATSTLAAYVSYTDLGTYVISGLNTNNTVVAFSGALLVAAMAGLVAITLGILTRVLTPLPLRRRRRTRSKDEYFASAGLRPLGFVRLTA